MYRERKLLSVLEGDPSYSLAKVDCILDPNHLNLVNWSLEIDVLDVLNHFFGFLHLEMFLEEIAHGLLSILLKFGFFACQSWPAVNDDFPLVPDFQVTSSISRFFAVSNFAWRFSLSTWS